PERVEIEVVVRFDFPTTDNEAEYEALIIGLEMALEAEAPRGENTRADALSKFRTVITTVKKRKITVKIRDRSSIEEVEAIQWVEEKRSWKSDIEEYLVHGIEPTNPIVAKTLKLRVNRFTMLKGDLSLAQKVTRQGYFWPTLVKDAMEFTKKCQSCQRERKLWNGARNKNPKNFTIVGNPQANGQTEVSNSILLQHLKTRMDGAKGSLVEELLGVLWLIGQRLEQRQERHQFAWSMGQKK
ncbi:UNVERIFIED_CONTAM: hypothetical protein Sangu_0676900, partial [Sesamum angustifolium]